MARNGTRTGKGGPTGKAGKKPIVTVTVTTRPAAKSGSRAPVPPPPSHTGVHAGVGSPSGRRR